MCSHCNEKKTNKNINEINKRLAMEVKDYIKENWPQKNLKRLSFIGHSLGGVIIRAALPFLKEYQGIMYSFMTFSSPHLGCLNGSKLISTGKTNTLIFLFLISSKEYI